MLLRRMKGQNHIPVPRGTDNSSAGGVPEDQIKDETALLAPGAKDNDTVFVRKDGKVMAYVWSADDIQWSVLGEVTEGPGDNVNVAKKVLSPGHMLAASESWFFFIVRGIAAGCWLCIQWS